MGKLKGGVPHTQITLYMPIPLLTELNEHCTRIGMDRSPWIVRAIEHYRKHEKRGEIDSED